MSRFMHPRGWKDAALVGIIVVLGWLGFWAGKGLGIW